MCKWGTTVECWVKIPADLSHTKETRWDWKPIDFCIASMVNALNNNGLYTVGSCCGHGEYDGNIFLEDGRMLVITLIPEEMQRDRNCNRDR